jgi:hypothetical protein
MQSNPTSMSNDEGSGLGVKKKYDDKAEAEMRAYRNPAKQFVHPTAALRRCMMTAVAGRKFGKKPARMIIAGAVFPVEQEAIILNGDGKPAKGYEIDKTPVVVNKARVLRCRPKFFPWSLLLPLELDTELVTAEQVLQALDLGGRIIGIGEYRPDPSNGKSGVGTYGRFKAEIVK